MSESSLIYEELNKRWKSTCRLLLNEEVGALKDYEGWLSARRPRLGFRTVEQEGRRIAVFMPGEAGAPIIPFEKADFNRKFEPLSMNEIKDIDSIVSAVRERISYSGNVVLGTSQHVEASNDVVDSFYVSSSAQVWSSKYVSHSSMIEYGEQLFGCGYNGHFRFCIRSYSGDYLTRCLEADQSNDSSDCTYCFGLSGARNCMFCFNLKSPSYRIGNIQLPSDKYASIRSKLISEMAEMLKKEKKLPTLSELAGAHPADRSAIEETRKRAIALDDYGKDTDSVESEFSTACGALLGKKLGPVKKYGNWLSRFAAFPQKKVKSAFDGEELSIPDYCNYFLYPEDRIMRRQHALAVGNISRMDGKPESLSFSKIPEAISQIAFFTHEYNFGKSLNLVRTDITASAVNCMDSTIMINSKDSAYVSYAVESNSIFGSNSVRKSSYLLKCYLSANLSRCFEVDSSRTCTDLYFSHNCENVHDSMFCFNTKNRRNAIGNAELPKDVYLKAKEKIKTELADELEKKGEIALSVFNLKI